VKRRLVLGADTLCWHARLEAREVTVDELLGEAGQAGATFLQLNLHHARALDDRSLAEYARRADGEGLRVLASGDFVGSAAKGASVDEGRERVARWIHRATILGSPILRVASGFYRSELGGRPDLIAAEADHVTAVLGASLEAAADAGVRLLLENHSDFSAAEYLDIVNRLGRDEVGVFLDLINPVSSLEDPAPVVRRLAPLAPAGHVKDYELASDFVADRYHRRGFAVRWRYPGEGVADLTSLVTALLAGVDGEFLLSVEGLDNRAGVADQVQRLQTSLRLLHEIQASVPAEPQPA
jgi:sugar phosphate isomerase/epimerase